MGRESLAFLSGAEIQAHKGAVIIIALVSHLDLQLAQLIIVHDPVIFPVDVGLLFIFIYLFQYCLAISRRISVTHR